MLGGAWLATHWLLRESAVWRDRNTDEVRGAQRDADYAYRLAVDPPAGQGAAAVRPRRLDDRPLRRPPHAPARSCSTRRRGCASGRSSGACCSSPRANVARVLVARRRRRRRAARLSAHVVVVRAARGRHVADRVRRAQLGARRRGGAGRRGAAPRAGDGARPARSPAGHVARPPACRRARSASATSRSPTRGGRAGARATSTSRSPPARRSPSSARTAPARRRSPSCCAGSTTRSPARSRSTASTCATSTSTSWRSRVTAVFQDFIRFELPLRDNVAPAGAPDDGDPRRARRPPAPPTLAGLDTVLARGYEGGTDLSGGQWQRVALARALCAVQARRRRRAARRADRAARRARRGRDLRPHPRRDAAAARRSSSRTASRPCATPTASACSSTAGSSSSARTTS